MAYKETARELNYNNRNIGKNDLIKQSPWNSIMSSFQGATDNWQNDLSKRFHKSLICLQNWTNTFYLITTACHLARGYFHWVLNISENSSWFLKVQPLSLPSRKGKIVNEWFKWSWLWDTADSLRGRDILTVRDNKKMLHHDTHTALRMPQNALLFLIFQGCMGTADPGWVLPGLGPAHHVASQTLGNSQSAQQASGWSWLLRVMHLAMTATTRWLWLRFQLTKNVPGSLQSVTCIFMN